MTTPSKISVSFDLERRGEVLYFRATHKPDAVWHGPYRDLTEVTETIAHYIGEDAIEAWYVMTSSIGGDIRPAPDET